MVLTPLKNDGVKVNGKDDNPYRKWKIKNVWNHQPDIYILIICIVYKEDSVPKLGVFTRMCSNSFYPQKKLMSSINMTFWSEQAFGLPPKGDVATWKFGLRESQQWLREQQTNPPEVQKYLDLIRHSTMPQPEDTMKINAKPSQLTH